MEHEVFVPVAAETVRQALRDPARVARCVPGLQQDADASAGPLSGRLKLRIGGHTITYRGTLRIVEQGEAFAVEGEGVEARGSGSAKVTLTIGLKPSEGGTTLTFTGTARSEGRLSELEPSTTQSAARRLLDRAAESLSSTAGASDDAGAVQPGAGDAVASGDAKGADGVDDAVASGDASSREGADAADTSGAAGATATAGGNAPSRPRAVMRLKATTPSVQAGWTPATPAEVRPRLPRARTRAPPSAPTRRTTTQARRSPSPTTPMVRVAASRPGPCLTRPCPRPRWIRWPTPSSAGTSRPPKPPTRGGP